MNGTSTFFLFNIKEVITIPIPTFTGLGPNPQFEDIVRKVNTLVNEIRQLMLGMDSVNMFEVGGWLVTADQLASQDGDVGMSTEDTAADDIRFWAGDVKTGAPKFKVTKAGIATMIQMILQSAASGQRVVIDSTGFHSYDTSGIERITIGTTPAKGAKALIGRNSAGVEQSVYTYDTETVDGASRTGQYITAHSCYILFDTSGDIRIQDSVGKGFRTSAAGYPEMNDGLGWVSIAKQGISGSFYVASTSGGSPTTLATFTNGVLTSLI